MNFTAHAAICPVVAILRGITPEETPQVCDALYEAGIRLLEIPLNSPRALESIRIAAERFPKQKLLVGAGTVLDVESVRRVADAGGQFIISPDANPEVIRATVKRGLVSIPGFLTPTEAFAATRAGADYLKLFPAGGMGPGYIADLKAVVKTPILAVGGVSLDNIGAFMKVCSGVGIGSALYQPAKPIAQIAADARSFVLAARSFVQAAR